MGSESAFESDENVAMLTAGEHRIARRLSIDEIDIPHLPGKGMVSMVSMRFPVFQARATR